MDVREKLVELLDEAEEWADHKCDELDCETCYAGKMKGNCVQKLMVDRLISHGVTVQEWISVKDRLPDKRGEYLCYYKFEPDSPDVVCENTYQGSGLWLSEMDKVTHWQPMPQPPKGE